MQFEWVHQIDLYTMTDIFREWFCSTEANRHEICTRLSQRVEN